MKILVACEFSGIVREAFRAKGHEAWSCDFLETEIPGLHYRGDVRDMLYGNIAQAWDLIIAHPPCTYLAVSGARWFKDRHEEQRQAIIFFHEFTTFTEGGPRVCIENPIGIMSTRWCKPTQIVQPWMFGHGETKATCLWLHKLPKLVPTDIVDGREQRIHRMSPGPERGRERSRTYPGIARAMADQWG